MEILKRFVITFVIFMVFIASALPTKTYATSMPEPALDSPTSMIAYCIVGLSNSINFSISAAVGYQLTIDDIVFNNFPNTRVDYFEDLKIKKEGEYSRFIWGERGTGEGGLFKPINSTYNLFRKIAIVGYMCMLIYMGIRISLSSTGESKAQYKTLFMYWVVGVAILFMYPYVMKYMIQINNSFVDVIEANKYSGTRFEGMNGTHEPLKETLIKDENDLLGKDYSRELPFEASPNKNKPTSYMYQIGSDSITTGSVGLALAYLVMTFQLLMLTIHYYKRVLMVGFLIAIFPLVALFYAVDKIADGKSQAFNHWNKEFMLNVFLQSFHAIIYAFVSSTIFASYDEQRGYDFIIVVIGVTFLFTGEEIIKKIFSQESPSKVASSAGAAFNDIIKAKVAVELTRKAVKKVGGKNGVIRSGIDGFNNYRAANIKERVFENNARPIQEPNVGLRLDHTQDALDSIDPTLNDAQQQAERARIIELANAIGALNNPQSRSAEELARARHIVEKARAENPNHILFQDLRFSSAQLDEMNNLARNVANVVAEGHLDPVTIDREVTLRLGYILNGMPEADQQKYTNMFWTGMAFTGADRFDASEEAAEEDIDRGFFELNRIRNSFNFRSVNQALSENERERKQQIMEEADKLADSMFDDDADVTKEERYAARSVARKLAVISNRDSGLFTADEFRDATSKLKKNGESNEVTEKLMDNLDVDIDLLRHMMAKEVLNQPGASKHQKQTARTIIDTYSKKTAEEGELDGHTMVDLLYEKDPDKYEQKRKEMIGDLREYRKNANNSNRGAVKEVALEILSRNQVDIQEGGMSEKRFLNGQSLEDIQNERNRALEEMFMGFAGFNYKRQATGGYSEEYKAALDKYNKHFNGDSKPTDGE